jgi:hypothetical protein
MEGLDSEHSGPFDAAAGLEPSGNDWDDNIPFWAVQGTDSQWARLPADVLLLVFSLLNPRDLHSVLFVCRRWTATAYVESAWLTCLRREWCVLLASSLCLFDPRQAGFSCQARARALLVPSSCAP